MKDVKLILGDCAEKLKDIPDSSVDLVVTSPPYDNLRTYRGYSFNFEAIAGELNRVIKQGGVIVWVVGDATVNGSETGTSFQQALYFKALGMNLHDTMIWNKGASTFPDASRYCSAYEYMFCFSKGKPKKINLIRDKKNKWYGDIRKHIMKRHTDGNMYKHAGYHVSEFGIRNNIWDIGPHRQKGDDKHPAPFPLQLAKDHINSWSNEGDIILDPMMGSGTTGVAALELNRKFIGIEISTEYLEMAKNRIESYTTRRNS